MSTVIMHNVVSVDGFIADADDQVGPLFDWYGNGDVAIIDGGQIKVSRASADYVKTMWAGIGSMVIGRHLFDLTNGWEGVPPAGDHVIVVSHRPDDWHPEGLHPVHPREQQASYYFINDVTRAITRAKELAGERTVAWRRATSAARRSPSAWSMRWGWTSCPWSSALASGTSGRSVPSICSRTRTQSSRATGCCTCATESAASVRSTEP
jgi:dihydrofolate reductase